MDATFNPRNTGLATARRFLNIWESTRYSEDSVHRQGAMKGVFTTKVAPEYDDLPERQDHFPRTYLRQMERCVGDWIVYYEPRRSQGNHPGGRQVYFATALVAGIREDFRIPDHFYADIQGYLEFPNPVPCREGAQYYEALCIGRLRGIFQQLKRSAAKPGL